MKNYITLTILLLCFAPSHRINGGNWLSNFLLGPEIGSTSSESDDDADDGNDDEDDNDGADDEQEDAEDDNGIDKAQQDARAKAGVLRLAIEKNLDVDQIAAQLRDGADAKAADKLGNTALHYAARYWAPNNDKLYWYLHDGGEEWDPADDTQKTPRINLEAQNSRGETPLHLAAGHGNIRATWWLINRGVDKNAQTKSDQTPLHRAAAYGHINTAAALMKAGAALEMRDNLGRTPLHVAVTRGHYDLVALLLSRNAHVNVARNNEMTPLHDAVRTRNLQLVVLLLRFLPNPYAKDSHDLTAQELAEKMKLDDIAVLLKNYEQWLKSMQQKDDKTYRRRDLLRTGLKALDVQPRKDRKPHLGIPQMMGRFDTLLGIASAV